MLRVLRVRRLSNLGGSWSSREERKPEVKHDGFDSDDEEWRCGYEKTANCGSGFNYGGESGFCLGVTGDQFEERVMAQWIGGNRSGSMKQGTSHGDGATGWWRVGDSEFDVNSQRRYAHTWTSIKSNVFNINNHHQNRFSTITYNDPMLKISILGNGLDDDLDRIGNPLKEILFRCKRNSTLRINGNDLRCTISPRISALAIKNVSRQIHTATVDLNEKCLGEEDECSPKEKEKSPSIENPCKVAEEMKGKDKCKVKEKSPCEKDAEERQKKAKRKDDCKDKSVAATDDALGEDFVAMERDDFKLLTSGSDNTDQSPRSRREQNSSDGGARIKSSSPSGDGHKDSALDPIQWLFIEKVKEYFLKSKALLVEGNLWIRRLR